MQYPIEVSESMKAWRVHAYCEPDEMSFDEVPVPEPADEEVLVRNAAAGVNFFDRLWIQGKYQTKPAFPFTPGAEVSGRVEAVGAAVTEFSPGDCVMAKMEMGGFAEYSVVPAYRVSPTPEGMDDATASGFLVVYQTSLFALRERARLRPGEWLLVHAGASGVGVAAIQLGKHFGAKVIATAGSEEKLAFCRAQGADHVLSYQDPAWVGHVKEITSGLGADVIYDPVGGDIFDLSTKCIAPGGRLLVVGFTSGRIPSVAANRILLKNISIVGAFWGRHILENETWIQTAQRELNDLYTGGKIRPASPMTFPLEKAPEALQCIADRKVKGKIALTIAPTI